MLRHIAMLGLAMLLVLAHASAQQGPAALAPTPPMGWNSWDAYGLTISEQQFRDNVAVLDAKLKPFGWKYAVVDEGWYLPNPMAPVKEFRFALDANGRYVPAVERFPSASNGAGFSTLAKEVHGRGILFGIHIVRGIPREAVAKNLPIAGSTLRAKNAANVNDGCPWNADNWGVRDNAAGQAWYDSLLAQYAGWGVDFLKVDCLSDHPYRPGEIRMIARAIAKTHRPIVLSLSPGPTSPALASDVAQNSNLWRISDDMWDFWSNPNELGRGLRDTFLLTAAWAPLARPGAWPDADMLPVGFLGPHPGDGGEARETRLTHDEQQTLVTLWSMARSPLIVGANLTRLDDWTLRLLTNADVLAVDQRGRNGRQVAHEGPMLAWVADGVAGAKYLAIFNVSDRALSVRKRFDFFNLPTNLSGRELWSGAAVARGEEVHADIPPHGCALFLLQ